MSFPTTSHPATHHFHVCWRWKHDQADRTFVPKPITSGPLRGRCDRIAFGFGHGDVGGDATVTGYDRSVQELLADQSFTNAGPRGALSSDKYQLLLAAEVAAVSGDARSLKLMSSMAPKLSMRVIPPNSLVHGFDLGTFDNIGRLRLAEMMIFSHGREGGTSFYPNRLALSLAPGEAVRDVDGIEIWHRVVFDLEIELRIWSASILLGHQPDPNNGATFVETGNVRDFSAIAPASGADRALIEAFAVFS